MKFLVHAQADHAGNGKSLGAADYSYFSIMQAFSKALADLGEVIALGEVATADAIHAHCASRGETCVLLSFAPPHMTPLNLLCPVIPVFAWEYPDIPERIEEPSWQDDPRNDWRHVLSRVGRAIALSTYAAHAVKRAMGAGFPVHSIPLPLPCRERPRQNQMAGKPASEGVVLRVHAAVADNRCMGLNIDGLLCLDEEDGTLYKRDDDMSLPRLNRPTARSYTLPASKSSIAAIAAQLEGESEPLPCGWDLPACRPISTRIHGVVYTAVLTPSAKKTNWHDLITAFCWTFRDRDDATLLLKLSDNDLKHYHHELLMALTKMSPMKCRVIGIYGHLTESERSSLRDITTYYVNTSTHEGVCAPLMEFLGHGIPAISPDHTAMADYITNELAFIVKSYPGVPAPWPHGDNDLHRTSHYQLDWESLTGAFEQSHTIALAKSSRYAHMSSAAYRMMQAYCAAQVVRSKLSDFIRSRAIDLTRPYPSPAQTTFSSSAVSS